MVNINIGGLDKNQDEDNIDEPIENNNDFFWGGDGCRVKKTINTLKLKLKRGGVMWLAT